MPGTAGSKYGIINEGVPVTAKDSVVEKLPKLGMTTRELIEAAMHQLENMPCGGVGEGGSTQKELDENVESGQIEDATHHNSQQAWLYLKQALANVIEDEDVEKRIAELCD